MSAVLEEPDLYSAPGAAPPVVVVGTGPVGIRVVEELLQRDPSTRVVIYGNEPWEPYNRVRLSSLLNGELNLAGIQNPIRLGDGHQVVQHHNCEVVSIDPTDKCITDRLGRVQHFSALILATGSSPHIPHIAGIDRVGVFTFRSLDDAQQLMARRARCRRAIVLGGGLLGLEAAKGLQHHNTEVYVVEHSDRLMAQQLDEEAATLLREHMLAFGVQVMLGESIKEILGEQEITGVQLRSGREIACDTLVVATGIRPNLELARNAGLSVGRGIRVNDRMQTSADDIYAVGECVEHRECVYGLVAPGLEQAGVAAHCILGGTSSYSGSLAATRLKVVGVPVFSMGRVAGNYSSSELKHLTHRSYDSSSYRKLILRRGQLVGAIAYGQWAEINRVQELIRRNRRLWPWQRHRFMQTGLLWRPQDNVDVSGWPASAVVCQCTGVTRGTLSAAIDSGHRSVAELCRETGAAGVCGSCKPLLAELAGSTTVEAEPGSRTLTIAGALGLLLALAILVAPALPVPASVQVALRWDLLWREELFKQISGFSLLGLGVVISFISLRKRLPRFSLGNFGTWRILHAVIGTLAVTTLIAHTGLRLGYNLNLLLMLVFTGLLVVGGLASAVIGLQHRLPRVLGRRVREVSLWLHIVLLWPLPALLGFHILKSYWY